MGTGRKRRRRRRHKQIENSEKESMSDQAFGKLLSDRMRAHGIMEGGLIDHDALMEVFPNSKKARKMVKLERWLDEKKLQDAEATYLGF